MNRNSNEAKELYPNLKSESKITENEKIQTKIRSSQEIREIPPKKLISSKKDEDEGKQKYKEAPSIEISKSKKSAEIPPKKLISSKKDVDEEKEKYKESAPIDSIRSTYFSANKTLKPELTSSIKGSNKQKFMGSLEIVNSVITYEEEDDKNSKFLEKKPYNSSQKTPKCSFTPEENIKKSKVNYTYTPQDDDYGKKCPVCQVMFDFTKNNMNRLPYKYPCSHIACMDCIVSHYKKNFSTCCICSEVCDLLPQDFKYDEKLYEKYSKIEKKQSEIKKEAIWKSSRILVEEEDKFEETSKERSSKNKATYTEADTPIYKKLINPSVFSKIMTTEEEKEERTNILSIKYFYENPTPSTEEKELTELILNKETNTELTDSKIKSSYKKNKDKFNKGTDIIFKILEEELKSDNIKLIITPRGEKSNLSSLSNLSSDYNLESIGLMTTYPDNEVSFTELEKNNEKRALFEEKFKKEIASTLKIDINKVKILFLGQGSAILYYTIIKEINDNNVKSLLNSLEEQEALRKIQSNPNIPLTKLMPNKTFRLCPQDFDPVWNFHFPNENGDIQERGGWTYYQPNNKWKRIGLRVLDRFASDGWLNMDGNDNEWAVAFHGLRHDVKNVVPLIIKQGLVKGGAQAYQKAMCKVFKTKNNEEKQKCGKGIYCSPKIDIAKEYTEGIQIENQVYHLVIQCRVRPGAIRVPVGNEDYWIIQQSDDIRPYGICLTTTTS